nr:MAG TPA: hypothetical protein [Caudoviricetes sp.]
MEWIERPPRMIRGFLYALRTHTRPGSRSFLHRGVFHCLI